jgi:carboxypeptidase PM20D1
MTSGKKAGFVAGAGIGAAAAIALRRRWSGPAEERVSVAPSSTGSPRAPGQAFLTHLAEAVRIPTVSFEDTDRVDFDRFAEFRDFLARTYPLTHEHLDWELVAGHSLLFTWNGSDDSVKPVVLMAHQDVVPIEPGTEEDWEEPPFSGEETEHYLYGRGSLDDKGSLIGIFEAVECLIGEGFEPRPTIYVACGHDEETGGTGAAAIAALLRDRGVHCSLVLDEGGAVAVDFFPGVDVPLALVGIGEKGYANVELTARGDGGHSSAPPPSTAIGKVASAVKAIEDRPMTARLDAQQGFFSVLADLLPRSSAVPLKRLSLFAALVERRMSSQSTTNALIRTTAAVTMMRGGVKPNVLPQEAKALVNFRIMPGDSVADVVDHVRNLVGSDVAVSLSESSFSTDPPRLADPDSDEFAMVADTVRQSFGDVAVAPWILTGATDSRHFIPIADQVLRFVPLVVSGEDFKRFHGTGERIRRADADAVVRFYRGFLQLAGGGA